MRITRLAALAVTLALLFGAGCRRTVAVRPAPAITVSHIVDGDTLDIETAPGITERVRLDGIDCPESSQAHGRAATRYLSELALGKPVSLERLSKDRNGRTVARVTLTDGRIVNEELVRAGYAWWFRRYAPHNTRLEQLEAEARAARRGLWADDGAVAPWDYRARRKKK